MEINQHNNGQGVEPAISQTKEVDRLENTQPKPEQPSMEVLLGEEGLGLDFPKKTCSKM